MLWKIPVDADYAVSNEYVKWYFSFSLNIVWLLGNKTLVEFKTSSRQLYKKSFHYIDYRKLSMKDAALHDIINLDLYAFRVQHISSKLAL